MGEQETAAIRIRGLTRLELRELTSVFPSEALEATAEGELAGAQHGDLNTWVSVIQLTPLTLPFLTAWLLKRRSRDVVEFEFEERTADGAWRTSKLRVDTRTSEAPAADALKELSQMLHFSAATGGGVEADS